MIVTLLAWMAQSTVSSNRVTKYASDASWSAKMAEDWNLMSGMLDPSTDWATSLIRRENGREGIVSLLYPRWLQGSTDLPTVVDWIVQVRFS